MNALKSSRVAGQDLKEDGRRAGLRAMDNLQHGEKGHLGIIADKDDKFILSKNCPMLLQVENAWARRTRQSRRDRG